MGNYTYKNSQALQQKNPKKLMHLILKKKKMAVV